MRRRTYYRRCLIDGSFDPYYVESFINMDDVTATAYVILF